MRRPNAVAVIFVGAASLLTATLLFTFLVGRHAVMANRKMAAKRQVLPHLEILLSTLKDAETGQRGYLLTGKESYLPPYQQALRALRSEATVLDQLIASGELPRDQVVKLKGLIRAKLSELNETIQLRRTNTQAALAIVASDRGKVIMDSIRAQVATLIQDEELEYQDAAQHSNRATATRTLAFLLTGMANLAFLGWAYRRIAREMRERETATRELAAQKHLLSTTLASIGDAVIITDPGGQVTFLNAEAERLSGWTYADARGQLLPAVFRIINETSRNLAENPVDQVLRLGKVVGLANHTLLISRDGRETPIDDSAAPIRQGDGPLQGVVLVFRDVSEQKKAEQQLRAHEELLRVTLSSIGDAVLATDSDGCVTFINPVAASLTGWTMAEALRQPVASVFQIVNEQTHAPVENIVARVLKDNRVVGLANHTALISKNRQEIPVEDSAAPIRDEQGHVLGVVLVFHDVTARRRAEADLQRAHQRLQTIINSITDGLLVMDREWRFTYFSQQAARIIGASREEMLGRVVWDLFPHTKGTKFYEQYHRAMATGQPQHFEEFYPEPLNQWLECHCYPSDEGLTVYFQDVTERVQVREERNRVEQALRESELQFRTLADSIPNLAWWADADGSITWYNRRWYEYTGATPEQMQGWGWQSVHDPKLLPDVLALWKASLATGKPFEMEFPLRGADGRFRWFLTRIMPVRDAAGQVARWFGTNTDVSETREAREVLSRGKAELERIVDERTARLRETVADLEQFSYSLAHDLRAPLRSMNSFATLLREDLGPQLQPEHLDYLKRIASGAQRMDELIRDVLSYTKVIRTELAPIPVALDQLVVDIVEQYPHLHPEQAEIEVVRPLLPVHGNVALVTQCISNFLGNAVKFVSPGVKPKIKVWSEPRQNRVRVFVQDNGIGIPEEHMTKIWRIFERAQHAKDYPGTGIGLSVVKRAAERMGGSVGVESKPGAGSTFWFELPK